LTFISPFFFCMDTGVNKSKLNPSGKD
jgi:hypothetical protein